MTRLSSFNKAKEDLMGYIYNKKPSELHRSKVAAILQIDVSTAGNYMRVLAAEYPESMTYDRGVLRITSRIPDAKLPVSARIEAKDKKIRETKETLNKIVSNHLNHEDKAKLRKRLKDLVKSLER